jgi:hypothetical protein
MKRLAILALVLGMVPTALGEVSIRVCLADGNTPLEPADPNIPFVYPEIMVGTRLTVIVSSDSNECWSGSLAIAGADMDYGVLSARDFNDTTFDWEGSRTKAAGNEARVWDWEVAGVDGFDFLTGSTSSVQTGDWFIIDYTATKVGACDVAFYYLDFDVPDPILICYLTFSHVPRGDFNIDTKVDFADFAAFASPWQETDCHHPPWCAGADLIADGTVDSADLMLFADYWLETAE